MQPSSRFGFNTWQKAVLWAAVVLCVWRVIQVPAIFDAILNFYAAGQVPGTNLILSPDAALWFVFGTSLAGATVLFMRLFVLRPRSTRSIRPAVQIDPVPTVAQPALPGTAPTALHTQPGRMSARAKAVSRRVTAAVAQQAVRTAVLVRRAWLRVRPYGMAVAAALRRASVVAARIAATYAVRFAAFVWLLIITAWHTAQPHIRRFDAWLELRLNQNATTASGIQAVRRVHSTLRNLWRRAIEMTDGRHQGK